jgi:hypothetical protein
MWKGLRERVGIEEEGVVKNDFMYIILEVENFCIYILRISSSRKFWKMSKEMKLKCTYFLLKMLICDMKFIFRCLKVHQA